MPREPKQFSTKDGPILERAIVLQLLRDDHAARWSEAELASEIDDAGPAAIRTAIGALGAAEVLVTADGTIQASRCTRHLDELELISI
jgi:hypothetical protein